MASPTPGPDDRVSIATLTERELIARLRARLPAEPSWLLVGVGDDAAVVEHERNRVDVVTVDAVVEGVHFDRAFVPPDAIGHRALAVNLSDLAAMGATPRWALLSFALPITLPLADFDGIVSGIVSLAAAHRIHVIGGNLTRSPGPLMIDITVSGTVKRRQAMLRQGARPGDHIYVSGLIGSAGAGLRHLQARTTRNASAETEQLSGADVQRYLYPEPRIRLGELLARNRAASACVDLSDGLSDGLLRLAESSGVGVSIDASAIPLDLDVRARLEAEGLDPVMKAMTAGDDYELLFTVRPRTTGRVRAAARHGGVPLTRIGVCTEPHMLVLRDGPSDAAPTRDLPRVGYDHFR